jgi:t-SNARE complex subunit (syntaxin)
VETGFLEAHELAK